MMDAIISRAAALLRRLFGNDKPVMLGRWTRDKGTKANIKADMANTDHCGTCSNEKMK